MGRGCNAVYSASGHDKTHFMFLSASLEEFLAEQYLNLRDNRYYLDGKNISVFRNNP